MQNYVGKQIDRYRIIERLGMGGMAVVYKAYDTRLERDVALKLIRTGEIPESQYERLMKRFEREAKSQARFTHRHIVPIHDYGEVDGSPYLVMSFIGGGTLKDRMQKGPVDCRQAIRWLIPVAEALNYAHRQGVIHRDVKPGNILFDREDQPILTDFGIAKILETDEATLTGTGLGVGTPEYMAPEQWQGKPGEASDQYALGVVLYELITGQKPYTADTPVAIALMQANEPLRAPSKIVKGIPEGVEKVLYKALVKNPADRYEDMDSFHQALTGLLTSEHGLMPENTSKPVVDSEDETIDALERTPVLSHQRVKEIKRRQPLKLPKWVLWAVIGLVVIGLSVGLVAALTSLNRERRAAAQVSAQVTDTLSPTEPDLPTSTATEEPTETLTPTPTITPTQTKEPTSTVTSTVAPTTLPDGMFIMPDFAALGVKEMLKFLTDNDLDFDLDVIEDYEAGRIISQNPEIGTTIEREVKIDIELTGINQGVFTQSSSAKLSVKSGDIFYIKIYQSLCMYEYFYDHYLDDSKDWTFWFGKTGCEYDYFFPGNYLSLNTYEITESSDITVSGSCSAENIDIPPDRYYESAVATNTGNTICEISAYLFQISD